VVWRVVGVLRAVRTRAQRREALTRSEGSAASAARQAFHLRGAGMYGAKAAAAACGDDAAKKRGENSMPSALRPSCVQARACSALQAPRARGRVAGAARVRYFLPRKTSSVQAEN